VIANLILLANVASTWLMIGLIWTIQLVHYPLFAKVGEAQFLAYENDHKMRITLIVLPTMLVELVTSFALLFERPASVPIILVWAGIVTVGINWLSTAFIQVPLHNQLSSGFDRTAIARLVGTNWIRTIAWTAHGLIVLIMLAACFKASNPSQ